jgi:hypothetical protein
VGKPLSLAAVALVLAGCGAQKPQDAVYILSDDVIVDLAGGGYASITLGLDVANGTDTAEAQTATVREVVSNDLTGIARADLLVGARRERLKRRLARDIRARTDIQLERVLLTDFTLH